ncbi:hypothetical protein PpBr36_04176 [Pyricularia pennisetigena]|uniref:hypothetical protein n=1 Tax=Pyricularia pennisetigena TaxID=1578925 RepID=UPI0011535AF2|nr:hypothetical protein PpBr36_04176 [Pyricularia pennisetigena]TLS26926.1 hypothetical protein PpBr36_04176 [Pyricularia pennisetigena]
MRFITVHILTLLALGVSATPVPADRSRRLQTDGYSPAQEFESWRGSRFSNTYRQMRSDDEFRKLDNEAQQAYKKAGATDGRRPSDIAVPPNLRHIVHKVDPGYESD